MAARRVAFKRRQHLETVHARHLDVEKDEVEVPLGEQIKGDLAVGRIGHVGIAQSSEDLHEDIAQLGVILNEQDGCLLVRRAILGVAQLGQRAGRESI